MWKSRNEGDTGEGKEPGREAQRCGNRQQAGGSDSAPEGFTRSKAQVWATGQREVARSVAC